MRSGRKSFTLRAQNIRYEIGGEFRAIPWGGIGAIHRMVWQVGLIEAIDEGGEALKYPVPTMKRVKY